MFGEDPRDIVREEVSNTLLTLARNAQAYYHRPVSEGGGGGSFVGLYADASGLAKITLRLVPTNAIGTYCITTAGSYSSVILRGWGVVGGTNGSAICVDIVVLPDSVFVTLNN